MLALLVCRMHACVASLCAITRNAHIPYSGGQGN